jgi:hypothetical protein
MCPPGPSFNASRRYFASRLISRASRIRLAPFAATTTDDLGANKTGQSAVLPLSASTTSKEGAMTQSTQNGSRTQILVAVLRRRFVHFVTANT